MKSRFFIGLVLFLTVLLSINNFRKNESRTVSSESEKETSFEFEFRHNKEVFKSVIKKPNKEEAFKLAAKECFQHFTQGVYPGEEKGLDIIDSCANPKKGFR